MRSTILTRCATEPSTRARSRSDRHCRRKSSSSAGSSVLNDAIAIYLNDATLAGAFVARWCVGYKVESADGVFQIREDAPTSWSVLAAHKTP